jgi:hypothetical protein
MGEPMIPKLYARQSWQMARDTWHKTRGLLGQRARVGTQFGTIAGVRAVSGDVRINIRMDTGGVSCVPLAELELVRERNTEGLASGDNC